MGNWKLTRAQEPQALTEPVLREMRHGRPAGSRGASSSAARSARPSACGSLEVTGGTLGFLWPNLSSGFGGQITLGDIDTVNANPAVQGLTLQDGAPAYFPQARTLRPAHRPEPRLPGRRVAGRRRAPRPTCGRSTSAARTSAASPTSAPATTGSSAPATARAMTAWAPRSRSSARRRAASTASRTRRGRRADRRHQQDHPRPAAGGARPAGPHPGQVPDGLHMSDERAGASSRRASRMTEAGTSALTPTPPGERRERRALLRRAAGAHGRADRGARRADRPPERQRAQRRLPRRPAHRHLHPGLLVLRPGHPGPRAREGRLASGGRGAVRHRRRRAATSCSSPTARAATATNGQGGVGPPLNDQAKLYNALTADGQPGTGHLNPNYIHERPRPSAAATCAATPTA